MRYQKHRLLFRWSKSFIGPSYKLVAKDAPWWEKFKRINGFWITTSNNSYWFLFRGDM